MKVYCSYHPMRPARWDCQKCGANLCQHCVRKSRAFEYGAVKEVALCPKCNIYVDPIAISNAIEPFWKRLHQFFLYPLHLRTLLFIVVVSALSSFFVHLNLLNAAAQFVLAGIMLRYAFSVLARSSHGSLKPPPLDVDVFVGGIGLLLKQILILATCGFVIYKVLVVAGQTWAFLTAGFLALSLPAILIVLAVSNSLVGALNPWVFVRLMFRIGWGYLLMVFFLALLGGAPYMLRFLILPDFPLQVKMLIYALMSNYYAIVCYHLMGYVMFQYHEEVGYAVNYEEKDGAVSAEAPVARAAGGETLQEVSILIKEGNLDEALEILRASELKDIDLTLAGRYFNLLKLKRLVPEMLEQGRRYLELLAKAGRKDLLGEVYLVCLAAEAGFKLEAGVLFTVAKALADAGEAQAALDAYETLIRENPASPLVPNALFFSAKLQNERLGATPEAAIRLKELLERYPFHENTNMVRQYLEVIQRG